MNRNPQEETKEIREDDNYGNAPACTLDEVAAPPDQRSLFFSQSFPLIAVCWLILLVIMVLRIHFTSVISENDTKLTAEIQNLTAVNQQLETQRNNLTEEIQNMETNWNKVKQCKACQEGLKRTESNCYAINNAALDDRKTWEEAREDCRGKGSDLVVVHSQEEKDELNYYSWYRSGTDGYWFGLRAEGGRWKWIDGSDLTVSNWTQQPPPTATDGQCVMSVQNLGWRSVSCAEKKQWICKLKALYV